MSDSWTTISGVALVGVRFHYRVSHCDSLNDPIFIIVIMIRGSGTTRRIQLFRLYYKDNVFLRRYPFVINWVISSQAISELIGALKFVSACCERKLLSLPQART